MKMRPASDKLPDITLQTFACLDAWAALEPSINVYSQGFALFTKKMLDIFETCDESPAKKECEKLFQILIGERLAVAVTRASLRPQIQKNTNGRAYRIVAGAAILSGEHGRFGLPDWRVRDFFEYTLRSKVPIPPLYEFLIPFWSEVIGKPRTKGREAGGMSIAGGRAGTVLEKLIFISGMAFAKQLNTAYRKQKPEVDTAIGMVDVSLAVRLGDSIAFGIQTVSTAWNAFAILRCSLPDLEALVFPYCDVEPTTLKWIPLPSPHFVMQSEKNRFSPGRRVTTNASEAMELTRNLPNNVDSSLRYLTKEFLIDLYKLLQDQRLYKMKKGGSFSSIEQFQVERDKCLASRFDRLDQTKVESVNTFFQQKRGQQREVPNTFLRRKIVAPMRKRRRLNPIHSSNPVNINQKAIDVAAAAPSTTCNIPSAVEKLSRLQYEEVLRDFEKLAKPYACLYNCSFEDIIETEEHDNEVGSTTSRLRGEVQLVLSDPPYNIRSSQSRTGSHYDSFTKEDMKAFSKLISELLRPGGHAFIFCSSDQFPLWKRYLQRETISPETDDKAFSVDHQAFMVAYHPTYERGKPGRTSCDLNNGYDLAVHILKNGLRHDKERSMVNYDSFSYVGSDYAGFYNIINNVKGPLPGERIVRSESPARSSSFPQADNDRISSPASFTNFKGGSNMWRPEQKPIELCKELIARFTQPGDLVVDPCAGTYSVPIACQLLPGRRVFVGCELMLDCHKVCKRIFLKRFAQHVVSIGGIGFDSNMLVLAQKIVEYSAEVVEITSGLPKTDNWAAPPKLPQYQALPHHMSRYFANLWKDRTALSQIHGTIVGNWPPHLFGRLQRSIVDGALAAEAVALDLLVAPTTIQSDNVGLGVFAACLFEKDTIICPYYGTLVYHNLLRNKGKILQNRMYGNEGIMGVSINRFRHYAMQVPVSETSQDFSMVKDTIDDSKAICVVPAPFCVASFINDPKYVRGDRELEARISDTLQNPRQANVAFARERMVRSAKQLHDPFTLCVVALRTIQPGEELFADYDRADLNAGL